MSKVQHPPEAGRYVYDAAFFQHIRQGATRSAQLIAPVVLQHLPIDSVLDIGCGAGAWLSVYRQLGIATCLGVDGDYVNPASLLIPPADFIARDVSRPFDLGTRFDLVQCLEVGEHVDSSASKTLVENLVRHGDVVLFSAAVPGQGGENHVNEQPYEFWRAIFAESRYSPYDFLRPRVAGFRDVEIWYRHNLMLYVADRARSGLAQEVVQTRIPDGSPIVDMSSAGYRFRNRLLATLSVSWISRLAILKRRCILLVRVMTKGLRSRS